MTVTTDQPEGAPAADGRSVAAGRDAPRSGSAGRAPGRSRARLVLVVVCGFLLVVEGVVGARLLQARSANTDARAQLDAQLATLDDALVQLDATRQRVDALRTDTADRGESLESSAQLARVRQLELVELTGDLGRISTRAADLRTSITNNHNIDQTQVKQIVLLSNCLDGIKLADGAAAKGDTNGTIAALNGVTDACQQALAVVNPGDNANFPFDFADPSVIYGNDQKYYAYATNSAAGNIQVISSSDLVKWQWVGGTLSSLPSWAVRGDTWAPSVLHRDSGYYMYYTARHAASGRQCISVATSKSPSGGFVDNSSGPLVCQLGLNGSIDPSPFVASDGTAYLLWKSEGEVNGGASQLWSRKLGDDFTSFDGDAHAIEGIDRAWEGHTIEGPSMAEANGKFYLFYSGNSWATEDYAEGWAVCDQPIGPCRKPADNILLKKHDAIAGPGGGEVFMAPGGQLFMSYHAWTQGYVNYPNKRQLHVDKLSLGPNGPQVSSVS